MTTRIIGIICLAAFCASASFAAAPASADERPASVRLENRFWTVDIEPGYAGRASRIHAREHDYDFVLNWRTDHRTRRFRDDDPSGAQGGAFAGIIYASHMSANLATGHLNQPYEVVGADAQNLHLRWDPPYRMFSGLVEERRYALADDRPEITLDLTLENRSEEDRIFTYRFQDWIGTGLGGFSSVYVCPQEAATPHAYRFQDGVPEGQFYLSPAEPWYAMADLPADTGLLVKVSGAPVAHFLQWLGTSLNPYGRTAEIYFPVVRLAPGESWSARVSMRAFRPSDPAATLPPERARLLGEASIRELLERSEAGRLKSAGPPMNARMAIPAPGQALKISPAAAGAGDLGTDRVRRYGGTLAGVHLYGTPGEAVPLVFNAFAREAVSGARLELSDLAGSGSLIGRANYDSWYVSRDGWGYLLRDWALAADLPDSVAMVNNDLRDSAALTPFSLAPGENAAVWNTLRIPENAVPGDYRGRATLTTGAGERFGFDITLTVHPFTLLSPPDKAYGNFFRFNQDRGEEGSSRIVTARPAIRRALEGITARGYNALTLYGNEEEALWMIDQCVELGWRDSVFVLLSGAAGITPARLEERYAGRNFTFLAWTVDEPRNPHNFETYMRRVETRLRAGHRPTFTPNSPFGLIFTETQPELVPIMALNNPFFLSENRRFSDEGRDFYWYAARQCMQPNVTRVRDRLTRGIYFWKEPVNGIIDWAEDTESSRKGGANMVGFAGAEIVSRTGRENVLQALTDMRYLYTLERMAAGSRDRALRAEAEALLDWFRATFRDNPFYDMVHVEDLHYLDELRREVGLMAARLARGR